MFKNVLMMLSQKTLVLKILCSIFRSQLLKTVAETLISWKIKYFPTISVLITIVMILISIE